MSMEAVGLRGLETCVPAEAVDGARVSVAGLWWGRLDRSTGDMGRSIGAVEVEGCWLSLLLCSR